MLKFDNVTGVARELDCGHPTKGLVYCRKNGSTGSASAGDPGLPFPGPPGGTYDADGDGFGSLDPSLPSPACPGGCKDSFFLLTGARTDQIGSGDIMIERLANGDSITAALQYVFATAPALARYSDTAGHSATVAYPVPGPGPEGVGGLGTYGSGFPVAPGADGKIRLRLTLWRPQRKRISSDPPTAQWMDVGHLTYGVATGNHDGYCPQTAFREDDPATPEVENDPLLSPATPHLFLHGGGGFDDARDDAESVPGDSGPATTLRFTLNLSDCFEANGVSFASGDQRSLMFEAAPGAPSTVSQTVYFKHQ